MELQDRIVEFKRVAADELSDHGGNFRVHPNVQKNMMKGILDEVGIAGALVTYHSERNGGKLTLIDGHMRKNEFGDGVDWPVVVTDLNDEEADKLLTAHDPVGMLALADQEKLDELRAKMDFADASVRVGLDTVFVDGSFAPVDGEASESGSGQASTGSGGGSSSPEGSTVPEMELQPYEHYDYVMVLARNVMDWNYLVERLGLERCNGSTDPRYEKAGLGRGIPAEKLIEVLREADAIIEKNSSATESVGDTDDLGFVVSGKV